jgi:PAS domain S-box-containing protein
MLSQALRNKEDIEITVVNHNKGGERYYNQLEIASVFDDRGNHTNFIAIQKDITDEIRIKQEIIKINSRFELIANFSKIGIWEHDTNANTVNWNHVMFQISGLGAEKEKGDYIGLWKEYIHPEDRTRILEEIRALRHNRQSHVQQEFRAYRHTDRSLRILQSLTIAERDAKGMLIRLVGSLRDITEMKQLQARLETAIAERDNSLQTVMEKNEELSKINLELDNFVYSISHDLRSPLLSIKGILSLILSAPELSAEQIKLINMCLSSASRLDTTIQEILEYSRNSRMDVSLERVDVAEMVNNIFNDLRFASGNDIVLNINAPENPVIRTDRLRLGVLLKNIIGNSIKYRRQGIPALVEVSLDIGTDRSTISVKDNGEGIAPRHLGRVFDMFYRGTTSSIGTGLGLYICKEIAGKLGGDLSIESQAGAGTTVHIILPVGRSADHQHDATLKK